MDPPAQPAREGDHLLHGGAGRGQQGLCAAEDDDDRQEGLLSEHPEPAQAREERQPFQVRQLTLSLLAVNFEDH